jgi:hypothetical protein
VQRSGYKFLWDGGPFPKRLRFPGAETLARLMLATGRTEFKRAELIDLVTKNQEVFGPNFVNFGDRVRFFVGSLIDAGLIEPTYVSKISKTKLKKVEGEEDGK